MTTQLTAKDKMHIALDFAGRNSDNKVVLNN